MNHLKVYFLTYFMQNSQKLNMVGYTASNMWPKRYGGPCRCTLEEEMVINLLGFEPMNLHTKTSCSTK